MDTQEEELRARIEDGRYYVEARQWYNLLYIAPISQRIFFIIITIVSMAIFAMSIISITNLLPIKPRIPFVYANKDMMNEHPRMERFKEPQENANPALIRYYLRTFVEMHESYDHRRYQMYRAFVFQHAVSPVFSAYDQWISPTNPRSPLRIYGRGADLLVEVDRVTYSREQLPATATVEFSTILRGASGQTRTNWTASIEFEYTDLIERDTYDETIDDYVLDYDEPSFRVLNYSKRERLAPSQSQGN